jgi:hypothetical protein
MASTLFWRRTVAPRLARNDPHQLVKRADRRGGLALWLSGLAPAAEIYALKLQQKDHPFVGEAALVHHETAFRGFERVGNKGWM